MTSKKTPNQIDSHVGSRIRMRRTMLNISQKKLGEVLGITFQQVQKYEKGTNRIGASRLVEIASALKVDVSFFFEGIGVEGTDASASRDMSAFLHTPGASRLLRSYAQMTPEGRNALRTIADAINSVSASHAEASPMVAE